MTVSLAVVLATLLVIGLVFITFASVLGTKAKVQAVADMAALAGADESSVAVFTSTNAADVCAVVGLVVEANDMNLARCHQDGADVLVIVNAERSILSFDLNVTARARAGPLISPQ